MHLIAIIICFHTDAESRYTIPFNNLLFKHIFLPAPLAAEAKGVNVSSHPFSVHVATYKVPQPCYTCPQLENTT